MRARSYQFGRPPVDLQARAGNITGPTAPEAGSFTEYVTVSPSVPTTLVWMVTAVVEAWSIVSREMYVAGTADIADRLLNISYGWLRDLS